MISFILSFHDLIPKPKILKYETPLNYTYFFEFIFNFAKFFYQTNKFQIKL